MKVIKIIIKEMLKIYTVLLIMDIIMSFMVKSKYNFPSWLLFIDDYYQLSGLELVAASFRNNTFRLIGPYIAVRAYFLFSDN